MCGAFTTLVAHVGPEFSDVHPGFPVLAEIGCEPAGDWIATVGAHVYDVESLVADDLGLRQETVDIPADVDGDFAAETEHTCDGVFQPSAEFTDCVLGLLCGNAAGD